jgi:hypothetical protein
MKVQQGFQNVFSYAAGLEKWVNDSLPLGPLKYTFVNDFAIADWFGKNEVEDTYKRIKESWLNDYKAFTEVVIATNMLSWANDALRKQGYDGREDFITLYSDLYYRARDDFYEKYGENQEACDYFFEMTD